MASSTPPELLRVANLRMGTGGGATFLPTELDLRAVEVFKALLLKEVLFCITDMSM